MRNFVPGVGNVNAKLLILGEAPGRQEVKQGRPFVGPAGNILNKWLLKAGIKRSDCWVTNVSKYMGPGSKFSRLESVGIDVNDQIAKTQKEIEQIRPNCILSLGGPALQCSTGKSGISLLRGSILPYIHGGIKVVPTYHPAAFLYTADRGGLAYNRYFHAEADVEKAKGQSAFKEFILPRRNLWICNSAHQLMEFLYRNKDRKIVYCDVETPFAIKYACVVGFAFTPGEAISINLFDKRIPPYEMRKIWRMVSKVLRTKIVVGQNFKFDHEKLEALGFRVPHAGTDTMLKAHTLHPEFFKNLAFLTSIYTNEPYYKDDYKEYKLGKQSFQDMQQYNAKDCAVTCEVDIALTKELKEAGKWDYYQIIPAKMHNVYRKIESVGIKIDPHRQAELKLKYEAKVKELDRQLAIDSSQEINWASNQQVSKLLYTDLKLPRRKRVDEKTLNALSGISRVTDIQRRILANILERRRIMVVLSTSISALPDYDGRMRTTYKLTGTKSNRTSTNKLKPPARHFEKILRNNKIEDKPIGLAFQTISKHGTVGTEVRSMFVADPDHYIVEADLSQAEARIVAALAEDYEMLEMYKKKPGDPGYIDIHIWTASQLFQVPYLDITKKDIRRHIGKTCRHGGHYDMEAMRLMQTINTQSARFGFNYFINLITSRRLLSIFHNANPKIKKGFHEKIKKLLKENQLELTTPYGRKRTFFSQWNEDLFKEAYSYIPQCTVADHLKLGIFKIIDDPKIRIFCEAHDGISALVHRDHLQYSFDTLKNAMEFPVNVDGIEVNIPVELSYGTVWSELDDVD